MAHDDTARTVLDLLPKNPIAESLAIGIIVLAACTIGIQTRLIFSLASIWPANAFLLGILILRPRTNRLLTWLVAAAAYMIADAASGSEFYKSALLNGSNLATVAGGVAAAYLMGRSTISAKSPSDAMAMVVALVVGATVSSITGIFIGPALFGLDWISSVRLWFPSEFVNLAIFVPVLLTLGSTDLNKLGWFSFTNQRLLERLGAIVSLLASIGLMHLVGGPGASSYVVPSLLWCAVAFSPFACSILVMITCTWTLIAAPLGLIPLNIDIISAADSSSFRLGVSMISIGIFVVSVINSAWHDANIQLQHMAEHDSLTELMNRGAFMATLERRLSSTAANKTSLLMVDVDHFKTINDTYGHPTGDLVLQELASALTGTLRKGSIVGRLGGEEFAVFVDGPMSDGMAVAERIMSTVRALEVISDDGERLKITVSIGLAEAGHGITPGQLLLASDTALYEAKHGGRDRIVATTEMSTTTAAPRAKPPVRQPDLTPGSRLA